MASIKQEVKEIDVKKECVATEDNDYTQHVIDHNALSIKQDVDKVDNDGDALFKEDTDGQVEDDLVEVDEANICDSPEDVEFEASDDCEYITENGLSIGDEDSRIQAYHEDINHIIIGCEESENSPAPEDIVSCEMTEGSYFKETIEIEDGESTPNQKGSKRRRKKKVKEKFSCMLCSFTARFRWTIVKHINKKHETITSQCPHCFQEVLDMNVHLERVHPDLTEQDPLQIRLESENGANHLNPTVNYLSFGLEEEEEDEKLMKLFKCSACKFSTIQLGSMESHFRRKHLNDPDGDLPLNYCIVEKILKDSAPKKKPQFKCDQCDFACTTNGNLSKHITYRHTNIREECEICHKEFKDMRRHVKQVHLKTRNFPCPHCEYKCLSRSYLAKHIRNKHLDVDDRKKCEICGKLIKSMKLHMESQHPKDPNFQEKVEKCPYCEYTGKKNTVTSHVKFMHEVVMETCTLCGKEVNRIKMKAHMKCHIDNKFTCLVCLGTYREKRDLARHILYQHKKLRSSCEFCNSVDVTDYKAHVKFNHSDVDWKNMKIPNSDKVIIRLVIVLIGENTEYAGENDQIEDRLAQVLNRLEQLKNEGQQFTEEEAYKLGFTPLDFYPAGSK